MNLSDAKKRALQLVNEYSNNGSLISAASNADYTLRMNNLADYCQNEISDKIGIDATYTINSSTTVNANANGYKKYNLPTNYKVHRYVRLDDVPFYDYRIENNQIWTPESYSGTFTLGYYKYPTTIDDTTLDSYNFEIDSYAQGMIPYYLGGMIVADENAEVSNKLLNIYYERLGKSSKRSISYPRSVRIKEWW